MEDDLELESLVTSTQSQPEAEGLPKVDSLRIFSIIARSIAQTVFESQRGRMLLCSAAADTVTDVFHPFRSTYTFQLPPTNNPVLSLPSVISFEQSRQPLLSLRNRADAERERSRYNQRKLITCGHTSNPNFQPVQLVYRALQHAQQRSQQRIDEQKLAVARQHAVTASTTVSSTINDNDDDIFADAGTDYSPTLPSQPTSDSTADWTSSLMVPDTFTVASTSDDDMFANDEMSMESATVDDLPTGSATTLKYAVAVAATANVSTSRVILDPSKNVEGSGPSLMSAFLGDDQGYLDVEEGGSLLATSSEFGQRLDLSSFSVDDARFQKQRNKTLQRRQHQQEKSDFVKVQQLAQRKRSAADPLPQASLKRIRPDS